MRSLQRRKQNIWICEASTDDSHLEPITVYSKPEKHRVTVSNTSGTPNDLPAGITTEYTRYFISYDRKFKPKEGMVLFVDKEPLLDENGDFVLEDNGEPKVKPDYVISHIMDTAKGTIARYGIKKIAGDDDEEDDTVQP